MKASNCEELLIATSNPGKVKEIQLALAELPLRLRFLEHYPILSAPVESGQTYAQNAIIKATDYAQHTGVCALADDSGLEVDWLAGAPGVHSARFGKGSDSDGVQLLLSKLAGASDLERKARFVSAIAIVHPSAGVMNLAEGEIRGSINYAPLGESGFGYDPIFVPDGYQLTFAQLPLDLKNRISHRAKALASTREFLTELLSARLTVSPANS